MKISSEKKIADVQREFNLFFPFLKLDFYGRGSELGAEYSAKNNIEPEKTIQELGNLTKVREITLFSEMSVSDLETIIKESFGLSVNVLRKAGSIWLKTSHSDAWSLEEQNRQGEKISNHLNKQKEERNI